MAPPGHVLVAIDYSTIEVVALAQHCYTKYGFSRFRELINMGVDVHRWLGAKATGLLTPERDLSADSTQEDATALNEWLKTVVDKDLRSFAKCAVFGLPGGMSGKTFFHHCQLNGINVTLEKAEWLREEWLKAFPEMVPHLASPVGVIEVDDLNSNEERKLFESTTITGRRRVRCTRNAALNAVFQGLTSDGCKRALWSLWMAGARMVNFIHDELLFELPEDRMDLVPLYAGLMEASMAQVTPDVTVRTESTAMRRWDKAAHSEVDEDGMLSIYEEEE